MYRGFFVIYQALINRIFKHLLKLIVNRMRRGSFLNHQIINCFRKQFLILAQY